MKFEEIPLDIDSREAGNESRFINTYQTLSDKPNAEFLEIAEG
jgi:hypothetical protein